jgi:hypothetical protein
METPPNYIPMPSKIIHQICRAPFGEWILCRSQLSSPLMNNHSQSQSYHIMSLSDPIVQMLSAGICGGCRGLGWPRRAIIMITVVVAILPIHEFSMHPKFHKIPYIE